ncbi:MAG TPA: hypothetical protein VN035_07955 [Microbacterium sp.]|nr:hypothetical protein [Microbacterium sp.]
MTVTTIKVSTELRDQLKEQAAAEHRTLGEHLAHLAERAERDRRFARLREQIARTSPEDMASYRTETEWWDLVENG